MCNHDYELDKRWYKIVLSMLFDLPGYRDIKCKKCGDEKSVLVDPIYFY